MASETSKDIDGSGSWSKEQAAALKVVFMLMDASGFDGRVASLRDYVNEVRDEQRT